QPVQRLAFRGRLARPLAPAGPTLAARNRAVRGAEKNGGQPMKRTIGSAAAAASLAMMVAAPSAAAQKSGGFLRMYTSDSPASMSIHEEATVFAQGPMMGVFNNLVVYDQQ